MEVFSFTISYKCTDINDGYEQWINIDHNSLHYRMSKSKVAVFKYSDSNKTLLPKEGLVGHHFKNGEINYYVIQKPSNPIYIKILDIKNDKKRYSYQCKAQTIFNDGDDIPITWSLLSFSDEKKLSMLKEYSKKVDGK